MSPLPQIVPLIAGACGIVAILLAFTALWWAMVLDAWRHRTIGDVIAAAVVTLFTVAIWLLGLYGMSLPWFLTPSS